MLVMPRFNASRKLIKCWVFIRFFIHLKYDELFCLQYFKQKNTGLDCMMVDFCLGASARRVQPLRLDMPARMISSTSSRLDAITVQELIICRFTLEKGGKKGGQGLFVILFASLKKKKKGKKRKQMRFIYIIICIPKKKKRVKKIDKVHLYYYLHHPGKKHR